ncbi:pilus assembly protein TadG-related protein [Sulfitobacter sp. PR48]|uniref:TadE/TadG family type IV pilus assembly protein n=1 Tax=Sulfitobacter sp. PR48 TaxID=3028383 RepID=UPI00237A4E99|nr:TadE/TadG family type IV pilus assembly protein [Sulfitobacter sp. PR48]MDD9719727.1 pilus assembly protein TadG-related protein [Sulfitobacter sp. PR48]
MTPAATLQRFRKNEHGGVLLLWAVCVVMILGFFGLIFDVGRLAATQSELQSYADSVSLAAAAELDGKADSIARATSAASSLISDSQTFGDGARALDFANDVTLVFYKPGSDGKFQRSAALETTNSYAARFVEARIRDRDVRAAVTAAFSSLTGEETPDSSASASGVAGFSLEACNVAPVAMCLPAVDFDAASNIGKTLEVKLDVNVSRLIPGQLRAVHTLTDSLDGLQICAGLLGKSLAACLLAARQPETACAGGGGLHITADVSANDLADAINTRFDKFSGIASGFQNNPNFSAAPNVLTGLLNAAGLCLPVGNLLGLGNDDIGLPTDDCLATGGCSVQGNGVWDAGRTAYIEAHYGGEDPHPEAQTRFEFYQAEIEAAIEMEGTPLLGAVGGLLGGIASEPRMCAPQANKDIKRRLMVVAGIDCLSAELDAAVTVPPVQQFFEVFTLGPAENGLLNVEITACLGGNCGGGNLDTEVVDVVRLVE